MNTESNTGLGNSEVTDPGYRVSPTRPLYWSVWRELWENHSIYVAPLIVAAVILFGSLAGAFHLPELRRNALLLDPAHQRAAIERPSEVAAIMLIFTAFIVGVFYCLDALHGERRDRSTLFWKSLPVSDFTTVVSKAIVPLAVLPLATFVIAAVTQFFMMLISTAALASSGLASTTWTNFNLFHHSSILLYGLVAIALWHAPIYAWLLLVSGWARRAIFLWAVLPFLAIGFFERITFGTSHLGSMLKNRLLGFAPGAFAFNTHTVDSSIATPGKYLSTPGLWIGLIAAAVFLAAAIRLRRYRGPI